MTPTWQTADGSIRLFLGDCRHILPVLMPQGDAMIFDPPYGIAHESSHGASWENTQIAGDGDTDTRDAVIARAENYAMPWACFGTWKVTTPHQARGVLVWDKGPAFGMGDLSFPWKPSWEEIAIGGEGWQGTRDEGVIRGHIVVSWETKGRCHPHQKPVSLVEYLLDKLPNARTICDPTMGSGTTGVACARVGLAFIGCEIDERHFATAVRRITAELNRAPLFEPPPIVQRELIPSEATDPRTNPMTPDHSAIAGTKEMR